MVMNKSQVKQKTVFLRKKVIQDVVNKNATKRALSTDWTIVWAIDWTNVVYTLSAGKYKSDSLYVYVNWVMLTPVVDYVESDNTIWEFTLTTPISSWTIIVMYK